MTFKELLAGADVKEAVRRMRERGLDDDVGENEQTALYEDFAARLLEIEPKPSNGNVLLGRLLKDEVINEERSPFVDVSAYEIAEIEEGRDVVARIADGFGDGDADDLDDLIDRGRDLVRGCAFEFSEWKEILGWEVDPENVRECGEAEFVAYVLYEMSFNGVYEEDQQERRDELFGRVEELEEIMKLPEEERKGRFVPAKDLFKDWKDERTEEEKEAERTALRREIAWNMKSEAQALERFLRRRAKA